MCTCTSNLIRSPVDRRLKLENRNNFANFASLKRSNIWPYHDCSLDTDIYRKWQCLIAIMILIWSIFMRAPRAWLNYMDQTRALDLLPRFVRLSRRARARWACVSSSPTGEEETQAQRARARRDNSCGGADLARASDPPTRGGNPWFCVAFELVKSNNIRLD